MLILLLDDHKIVHNVLSKFLQKRLEAEVLECATADEALIELKKKTVDLIITDICMPEKDGVEFVRELRSYKIETPVIALSMMKDSASIKKMLGMDVDAYLLKSGDTEELVKAIEAVQNKQKYYSNAVKDIIMNSVTYNKKKYPKVDLTNREMEILRLLLEEKSNTEIAEQLSISHRTVETHKHNIIEKANAKNMAGLVRFALNQKLFQDLFY
ncbi:response regulator transcription factor [Reichenbachiella versicolor]|uniref:response regulator transcription factor n=1 Tax=Reichenbachiella versicolor TaxID=1821036 RepID=UPI000D6E2DF8|nr:response regulator transcription factor [Reichenbachiella versicolor]